MSIPEIQQAWRVVGRGDPSKVLRFDRDVPVPKKPVKGEVLIKVHAVALNPVGYKIMRVAPSFVIKRPYISESDLAGTVVDANGTSFKEGDRVYGWIPVPTIIKTRMGALAQYTRVPANNLVPIPENTSPVQAAGITLASMTAYQALFDVGGLQPEQSVFINGGSSAVGAFAIQLAKAAGCTVTASASGKNEEYVRSLGADKFVDYTKAPLHETLANQPPTPKYHVFLEAVGLIDTSLYTNSEAYLAPGGTFVSLGPQPKGFDIAAIVKVAWKVFLQPRFLGGTNRSWKLVQVRHKREDLEQIARYVAEGKVKPIVDSVYSFEDTLKAYDRLLTSRATGKVVIKVDPDVSTE
ncbi:NAD(P)-binding protein [Daedalea quercina L-15889]|uniref:NAD(P)-binding protein n=1 Tax=Daedalea quercina L-15889 TaxID=1314783 RepID=A0A165Q6F1_9APHY|nr:NAD(P)-binding protein [Daedalea quercina L-15889]